MKKICITYFIVCEKIIEVLAILSEKRIKKLKQTVLNDKKSPLIIHHKLYTADIAEYTEQDIFFFNIAASLIVEIRCQQVSVFHKYFGNYVTYTYVFYIIRKVFFTVSMLVLLHKNPCKNS